jgi:hypothetical protein
VETILAGLPAWMRLQLLMERKGFRQLNKERTRVKIRHRIKINFRAQTLFIEKGGIKNLH